MVLPNATTNDKTAIKMAILGPDQKRQKLLELLNSVLDSPIHGAQIAHLLEKLSLSREDITQTFLEYNLDVHSHDNSIYNIPSIFVVLHVHNLIEGCWHIERQTAVCELIERAKPRKAIDLGFGTPSRYVKNLLGSGSFHLTLCDYQQFALLFAAELLSTWSPSWSSKVDLQCKNIEQVQSCVGDYDLYISLHSIEHVSDPTKCLSDYVRYAAPYAQFLIEIPIGPITPEHNIAWHDIAEAKSWIKMVGLEIIEDHMTSVNPEIDLFAEPHDFSYGGYLMLCRKAESKYATCSR